MKKAIKLTAAALAATLSLSLAACGSSASTGTASTSASADGVVYRTLDEIKADGTINIGVFSDKNPFGYVDENGEYQGYDIYFANRLAEDLGVKVNYVSTEAANRIEYLQTGKVDVILANFTVTPERAEEVDFALPYMNVALGVVSPDSNVITSLDSWNADDQMIVISGTTAETYLTQNYPDIPLQKYDSYATAKSAMENGGVAWANDNTEVIAFASQNPGYTVGIPSLGSQDTIAPAVSKGNETLLNAINDEIKALGKENFFHADYEATLVDTYGTDYGRGRRDERTVKGEGLGKQKRQTTNGLPPFLCLIPRQIPLLPARTSPAGRSLRYRHPRCQRRAWRRCRGRWSRAHQSGRSFRSRGHASCPSRRRRPRRSTRSPASSRPRPRARGGPDRRCRAHSCPARCSSQTGSRACLRVCWEP